MVARGELSGEGDISALLGNNGANAGGGKLLDVAGCSRKKTALRETKKQVGCQAKERDY